MKYDPRSIKLIEFDNDDIIKLLSFGYNNHPELLPRYSQYQRSNMINFKRSLDNLAYYYFKEILHAIK